MTEPARDPLESTPFARRLVRAARLDPCLFEEVEADRTAGWQALACVLLASTACGVGTFANGGLAGIVLVTGGTLVGWLGWAFITCVVGTRLLPEPQTESDLGELLRTLGFSCAPGIVTILGLVPGVTPWIHLVVGPWLLTAMVIALRQALDYSSTWRAVLVCLIGFPLSAVLILGSVLLTGPWPV